VKTTIRALRKKLRLPQADFGKLLGATPHAVYLWEKKIGALNLREKTKAVDLMVDVFLLTLIIKYSAYI